MWHVERASRPRDDLNKKRAETPSILHVEASPASDISVLIPHPGEEVLFWLLRGPYQIRQMLLESGAQEGQVPLHRSIRGRGSRRPSLPVPRHSLAHGVCQAPRPRRVWVLQKKKHESDSPRPLLDLWWSLQPNYSTLAEARANSEPGELALRKRKKFLHWRKPLEGGLEMSRDIDFPPPPPQARNRIPACSGAKTRTGPTKEATSR